MHNLLKQSEATETQLCAPPLRQLEHAARIPKAYQPMDPGHVRQSDLHASAARQRVDHSPGQR